MDTTYPSGLGLFPQIGPAAINDAGDVVFTADGPRSDLGLVTHGLYVIPSSTGEVTFKRSATQQAPYHYGGVSINSAGEYTYRFVNELFVNEPPLDRNAREGVGNPLPGRGASSLGPYKSFTSQAITDSGHVVFSAVLDEPADGSHTGIYDGPDPVAGRIADSTGPLGRPVLQSVRADDTIFFRGTKPGGGNAIYKGTDLQPELVFDLGTRFTDVTNYAENTAGRRVFRATVQNGAGQSQVGLFTGDDPLVLASPGGDFVDVFNPLINENGLIVFAGDRDGQGGADGIYLGPDPATDKVIQVGDAPFGSPITSLQLDELNNAGVVLFHYSQADGVQGIGTVRIIELPPVPEPSTLGLLALPAVWLLHRRR